MTGAVDRRPVLREFAGACGDLGTFLPLTIGAILVGGLPAASVLAGFGFAYALTAAFYRAPVPVQPMKVAGAVLVTTAPAPDVVIGAGLVLGGLFLLLSAGGLIDRLARLVPAPVVAALQAGLGLGLAISALRMLAGAPIAGAGLVLLAGLLLWRRPAWQVAIIVLALGAAAIPWFGAPDPGAIGSAGLAVPRIPGFDAIVAGAVLIALPQIPLTLTNAIIVTERTGRELFPRANGLRLARLSLSTGLMNLLTAPFAALPMCHGAGGLAAHHRFGARTWMTPAGLGLVLLLLGLFAGDAATRLLARFPEFALGALLLIPAIDLVRISRPFTYPPVERMFLVVLALVAIASPALAFALGMVALPLWYRIGRRGPPHQDGVK